MNYKIINTGTADQHIPTKHGVGRKGVLGIASQLGDKIVIPGTARGEEKNFTVVNEEILRNVFGLYENKAPGVLDIEKGSAILMKNVKRNKPLLDNGRLVVIDSAGSHVLGKGNQEYQSKVVDAAMQENQVLRDGYQKFIDFFVSQGFSEADAKKIAEGKFKENEIKAKLGESLKISTGGGISENNKAETEKVGGKKGKKAEAPADVEGSEGNEGN